MILRLNAYLLLLVLIPLSLDATKGVDVSSFLYNYGLQRFYRGRDRWLRDISRLYEQRDREPICNQRLHRSTRGRIQ